MNPSRLFRHSHSSGRPSHAPAYVSVAAIVLLLLSGCKKTPEYVLDREEMAQLLADIHMAEAVIDFNYSDFPSDSTRKLLKQSVYEAHGVTAEQVDTSFVWYGNNIEEYIKVYDRTIEILHQRQSDFVSANSAQIAIAGDSVAVWRGPERIMVSEDMPSRIVTFSVSPDSTWKAGDIYTLQYKPINGQSEVTARLLVDYAGGLTQYVNRSNSMRFPNRLQIQVDSTETPLRVYGYLAFKPEKNIRFEIDSISLTRQRKDLIQGFNARPEIFLTGELAETEVKEDSTEVAVDAMDYRAAMHRRPTTERHRPLAEEVDAPKSSSANNATEHRQDASQHKPTATQRKEARERQRSARPIKRSSAAPAKAVPMQRKKQ